MSPLGWLAFGSGITVSLAIVSLFVITVVGTKRGYVVAASFRFAPAPRKAEAVPAAAVPEQGRAS